MSRLRFAILALSLALVAFALPAGADTIRVGGTGMGLRYMADLGRSFEQQHDGHKVVVLPSLGSSGGIRALLEGAIDVALSSRPLKKDEAAAGLTLLPLVRTPFVLVTSLPEAVDIAPADLAAFYGDTAPYWPDGTPIRVILRQKNDSDNDLLVRYFPGMAEALEQARSRPEVPVAVNDQENLRLAKTVPGSLTAASLMQVKAEDANLRILPLSGVLPSSRSLADGSYGPSKTLYLVVRTQPNPATDALIRFTRSAQARDIAAEDGALAIE